MIRFLPEILHTEKNHNKTNHQFKPWGVLKLIKKKFFTILSSALLLMLVACNNNQGAAGDMGQQNGQTTQLNARNTASDYVTNVNNRTNNNTTADRNFMNDQDEQTNARRYQTRNTGLDNVRLNNRAVTDRNNNMDDNRFGQLANEDDFNFNRNTTNNNDFDFGRNVTNDDNTFIEHDLENPGSNISADVTTISSNKYPHTKAVLIQEAKYKHVKVDANKANQNQGQAQGQARPQNTNAIHGALKEIQRAQGNQAAGQQGQQAGRNQQQATAQNQQQKTQQQAQAGDQTQKAQQQAQQPAQTQQQAQAGKQGTQDKQQAAEKNAATAQNQQQGQTQNQQQAEAGNKTAQAAPNTAVSNFESKVIELTNAERRKNGLKDLAADTSLSNVAREKSNDMQKNNYFSHTSPTYGSPFDMMRDFGITYNTAGENIAQGQRTPEEVVQAWMNSEGHRKNILSDKFTHIGVGYSQSGHHWTQMFVGR